MSGAIKGFTITLEKDMHEDGVDAVVSAISMFKGGSLALIPESWPKKVKKGTLIPAWSTTPVDSPKTHYGSQRRKIHTDT